MFNLQIKQLHNSILNCVLRAVIIISQTKTHTWLYIYAVYKWNCLTLYLLFLLMLYFVDATMCMLLLRLILRNCVDTITHMYACIYVTKLVYILYESPEQLFWFGIAWDLQNQLKYHFQQSTLLHIMCLRDPHIHISYTLMYLCRCWMM